MSPSPLPLPLLFRQRLALMAWVCLFLVLVDLSVSAAAQPGEIPTASRCGSTYVVRRGDTLAKIAVRCRVSIRTLRALNGRAVLRLRPGMVLRLSAIAVTPTAETDTGAASPAESGARPAEIPATPMPTWDQTMTPPER